jgi:hypothetical protein
VLVILLVQFVNVIVRLGFWIQILSQFNFGGGRNIASIPKVLPGVLEAWNAAIHLLGIWNFSRFSLDAPNNAYHSSRAVHLAPRFGPLRHRAKHLSPRADHLFPRADHLFPRANHLFPRAGPRRHLGIPLTPRAAHPTDPRRHCAVLLAPRAAHPAGPRRHRAILFAPCAAHPAGPRRHHAVLLAPRVAHPVGPRRHCVDRHTRELRVLGGCLMTFLCLLRPQCSFGTECTPQGPRVLNCSTVYTPSSEYPQASPSDSRGVNLFPRDDHRARWADQLAPRGIHFGGPHRV